MGTTTLKLFGAAVLAAASFTANAAVNVSYDNSSAYNTTALTGYSTNGAEMDGMAVTAYFLDGGSQTLSWADIDSDSGGVAGVGWSLRADGDTFSSSAWTLTSVLAIDRIFIDAGVGNTVFDINWSGEGSPGSASGRTFTTGAAFDINATYSGIVSIGGAAPVGDLWRYLDIDFVQNFSGRMIFGADTDNMKYAGDITPVPEPAGLALMGLGLLGLLASKRRFS